MRNQSEQIQFDPRYVESLLLDEANIFSSSFAAGRELLQRYSKIPKKELASHVTDIQRRAYACCPYPCIGLLRFLICTLSEHHLYPLILSRLHEGAAYLDVGCCLAQDIRKLAYDGAPTTNCIGIDLEPRFFTISEDLFRDRGRLSARFYKADIFQNENDNRLLAGVSRSFDVVHASSFFHLFGLPKQRQIALAIAKLVRPLPGSLVLGLQIAAAGEAENIPVFSEEEPTYCHSLATMQALWDDTLQEAGLKKHALEWKVGVKEKLVPKNMRIGHFANPKLTEVMWIAELVWRPRASI